MSFRLVPKSVTLNDFERHNGRYFALFQRISVASGAHCVKVRVRYLISWWVLVQTVVQTVRFLLDHPVSSVPQHPVIYLFFTSANWAVYRDVTIFTNNGSRWLFVYGCKI